MAVISASVLSSSAMGRTLDNPAVGPAANEIAHNDPATAPHLQGIPSALAARRDLRSLEGAVASEIQATRAFVKESVIKDPVADKGLILLAALGMIGLQLRRKHKSLLQRPIAPYA